MPVTGEKPVQVKKQTSTKAQHETIKAVDSSLRKENDSAGETETKASNEDSTKRQRQMAQIIRRLSAMVQNQVDEFQREGILTERLENAAAAFTATTDSLASSIEENSQRNGPFAELQRKTKDLFQKRRKKGIAVKVVKAKDGGSKDQVPRPKVRTTGEVQQTKKASQAVSKSVVCTPSSPKQPVKKPSLVVVLKIKSRTEKVSMETASTRARRPLMQMPGFEIMHEDFLESPDEITVRDMGRRCREWCKVPPTPEMRIMTPEILSKHEWRLSLISNLPKRPGHADEDHDEEAAVAKKPAPETTNDSPAGTPVQDVRKSEFNWSAFHVKAEPTSPTCSTSASLSAQAEREHETQKDPNAHLRSPSPAPRPSHHNESPRRHTSFKSQADCYRPAPKRPRSPSPQSSRRSNKLVCLGCPDSGAWCTSEPTCEDCEAHGRRCEYMRCKFGLSCRATRCIRVHPGQLKEEGGKWRVVDV